jgi:hypothetical protein
MKSTQAQPNQTTGKKKHPKTETTKSSYLKRDHDDNHVRPGKELKLIHERKRKKKY